ncbi:Crp/Fnr family transcriptional regulator [Massilia aquatica]|uniref:Crp/Fnr family transcriptional regulator n=1 Tax=Massilia aquatica TaxID=2609000 RepID=A0ABX0MBA9_9BURK|nr:Crp/Fnr family transcriptional regulator [Massilia aquatica]NHZ41537.1 Crp/Fnr family transcriptional regulator [Massilia aquatica]
MLTILSPSKNRLLAELERAEYHRLSPYLELIALERGDVLYQVDGKMDYVYFPVTATISIDYLLENGGTSEINRVGNEGMLGVPLFMGGDRSAGRAVVQSAGYAYRLGAARLMAEFYNKGPLLRLLLRYAQARLMQVSQLAACNSHHSTRQRLCRYLLQMLDRSSSNELAATQEEIGGIIGVRREGVTDAARWLQERGIIRWRRGHVTVLSRSGLHAHVCECYDVVCHATALLLPDLPASSAHLSGIWRASGALPPYQFTDDRRHADGCEHAAASHAGQAKLAFL